MDFDALLSSLPRYTGLAIDSRTVERDNIFVAGGGPPDRQDEYIARAVGAGAAVVVGESRRDLAVPFVSVPDFRAATAALATRWYRAPSRALRVIGVTGTCGKTTTTYLLESIFRAAGERVGVIGTVSFRYPGYDAPASHTTPDAIQLQRLLADMRDAGCSTVIMEVSSHALAQQRVEGIAFDAAVFTNFSLEHLDYHRTLDEYFAAKVRLFTDHAARARDAGKTPLAVVNRDDERGRGLLARLPAVPGQRVVSYSPRDDGHTLRYDANATSGSALEVEVRSPLIGRFNGENLLAAIATARALDVSAAAIETGIAELAAVPGRLEPVRDPRGQLRCLVDYAHKPGALERVLVELRAVANGGRLICVVGCGGDRDRAKRPIMGGIAARLADVVWITSDNPRSERPEAIVDEVRAGATGPATVQVEVDRGRAIERAIDGAAPGDIVVIAGRGHEPDLMIGDRNAPGGMRRVPFDDRVVAADVLARRNG